MKWIIKAYLLFLNWYKNLIYENTTFKTLVYPFFCVVLRSIMIVYITSEVIPQLAKREA